MTRRILPIIVKPVVLVWLWELVSALLIAAPVHGWARQAWATHPDGDAPVFEPGGHALLSWLGNDGAALSIVLRTTLLLFVFFAVIGQLVTGIAIAWVDRARLTHGEARRRLEPQEREDRSAMLEGTLAFLPLVIVTAIMGGFQLLVLGVGAVTSSAVDHRLAERLGDARSFAARMVVLAVFGFAVLAIGVIADLVRVAVVRSREPRMLRRLRAAAFEGLRTFRSSPGGALSAWGWRAALSLALVWVGALAGDRTGGRDGAALAMLFVVHQLIVVARAGLRVSWLSRALALVETTTPTR